MSPTTDNFIHSLVEMSKAFEELPTVRSELDRAHADIDTYAKTVQAREEAITRYKAEIDALQAKVRDTEAQRDDAELRFLELDEKASKTIHLLAQIRDTAVSADNILTPPRPEPEPKHEPQPETGYVSDASQQGQSERHPTSSSMTTSEPGSTAQGDTHSSEQRTNPTEVPKSDANPTTPTASSTDGDGHSPSTATPTPTAQPIDGASSQAQPTTQPYAGKRYYDHPIYLTRDAWHAGGGTDADYDWRPGRSVGF